MFARYAYAPNALGYCGPPLGATLRDGSVDEVRSAATRFSGAWPYLRVLSELTGIADPLDYRLVESYWLGGGVGAGFAQLTDLGAGFIGLGLELFGLRDGGAPPHVEFAEAIEIRWVVARRQPGGYLFEIVTEISEIVHDGLNT